MAAQQWVYELATGKFLYGGFYEPTYDVLTQGVVQFQDSDPNPNPVTQRYDATSPTCRRLATQAELDADVATTIDADATRAIDGAKAIKAAVITALWGRLGRQPTGAELSAERTRFIGIYKAL